MTIVNPSADALRQIELPSASISCGNGRGVPMRRYTMIDSTLLLTAVQCIVIAALLPLEGRAKLVALGVAVLFTIVAAVISRRRSLRVRAIRDERGAIIRWLAIHSGLDHRNRLALAWSEPQEIGDRQYEFRTLLDGRQLSLIIDLDIRVASLAIQ